MATPSPRTSDPSPILSSPSSPPPLHPKKHIRSSTLFIVLTVGLGIFSVRSPPTHSLFSPSLSLCANSNSQDLFLYSLIVPIIPFIVLSRLHLPPTAVQRTASTLLSAYALASVLCSPLAGVIADRLPRRQWPFLFGLAALAVGTSLLCVGRTLHVLVLGRALQGVSTAFVWTVGLALLRDTVGSARLGVTVGSIFGVVSVGQLAAPVLGGLIYERAGYDAVFGVALALVGVDFVMRLAMVERPKETGAVEQSEDAESTEEVDEASAPTAATLLLGKGAQLQKWRIESSQTLSWMRRLPILYLLTDSRLLAAEFVAFMQSTLLATFDATLPAETQAILGFNSLQVGLIFLPLVVPYLFLNPVFGKLVDRYGPKPAAIAGFTWEIMALNLLRLPIALSGGASIAVYCVVVALNGIGLAAVGSSSIVAASLVAEGYFRANPDVFHDGGPYAQLYSVNSLVRYPVIHFRGVRRLTRFKVFSGGLAFGPVISGLLRESLGYGNMNSVMAGLSLFTASISYIYLDGWPQTSKTC